MDLQGWQPDPFGRFSQRYFSAGQPTKLVRSEGREFYDPVPSEPDGSWQEPEPTTAGRPGATAPPSQPAEAGGPDARPSSSEPSPVPAAVVADPALPPAAAAALGTITVRRQPAPRKRKTPTKPAASEQPLSQEPEAGGSPSGPDVPQPSPGGLASEPDPVAAPEAAPVQASGAPPVKPPTRRAPRKPAARKPPESQAEGEVTTPEPQIVQPATGPQPAPAKPRPPRKSSPKSAAKPRAPKATVPPLAPPEPTEKGEAPPQPQVEVPQPDAPAAEVPARKAAAMAEPEPSPPRRTPSIALRAAEAASPTVRPPTPDAPPDAKGPDPARPAIGRRTAAGVVLLVVGIVALPLAALFLIHAAGQQGEFSRLRTSGVHIGARITRSLSSGQYEFRFATAAGKTYTLPLPPLTGADVLENGGIEVVYDPRNPTDATVAHVVAASAHAGAGQLFASGLTVVAGLGLIAGGLALLMGRRRSPGGPAAASGAEASGSRLEGDYAVEPLT